MHPHRGEREDGGDRRESDEDDVQVALERIHVREPRLERDGEEESREDLGTGLHDAQFLQELVPVAVGTLVRGLVASVFTIVELVVVARQV